MKRLISFILIAALLLSLTASGFGEGSVGTGADMDGSGTVSLPGEGPMGEEQADAADSVPSEPVEGQGAFLRAFTEWISALNLNEYDLEGRAGWEPGTDVGLTLRQEEGTLEADLENVGRVQVSPSRAAAEYNGQRIIVDIASLSAMVMNMVSEGGKYAKDGEMLLPWLQKGLMQILHPCLKSIGTTSSGITLQIEADSETIMENIRKFVDEAMQEEKTLRTLMEHYGPTLALIIPGMYKDFEQLKAAWQEGRDQTWWFFPRFSIIADVMIQRSWNALTGIICRADITFGSFSFALDLEYAVKREGLELRVSYRPRDYYRYYGKDSQAEFTLTVLNKGGIDGRLILGEEEYVVHLDTVEKDKSYDLTGRVIIKSQYNRSRIPKQFLISGRLTKETGAASLTVDRVENAGQADEETTRVADADLRIGINEVSGTLIAEGALYDFRLQAGFTYSVLQVNRLDRGVYERLVDLSLMRGEYNSVTIRLETSLVRELRGLVFRIGFSGASFEAEILSYGSKPFFLKCGALYSGRQMKGMEFKYYNSLFPALYTNKPVELNITWEDGEYRLETGFPIRYYYVRGNVRAAADGLQTVRNFDAEVTLEQYYIPAEKITYRVYTANGALVLVTPKDTWRLKIQEDNAGRFAAVVLRNEGTEAGKIILELDRTEGFTAGLWLEGQKKGTLTLRPKEKSAIVPIDPANALIIDAEYLQALLGLADSP